MQQKTLSELKSKLAEFINERNWNQFHTPKNLVMALSIEVSELMEHFLWRQEEDCLSLMDSEKKEEEITDEMADIFNYLLHLSMILEIDLIEASMNKIEKNKIKYSKDKADEFTLTYAK